MIGAICGDIVGSIYEFDNIKTKEFPLFGEGVFFTDDTVMTCAVARACLTHIGSIRGNRVSEKAFKTSVKNNMRSYGNRFPGRGYGGSFLGWLLSSDPRPYNSWGNGSAMRVSPVGFAATSLEQAEKLAAWSAEVTHNHPEGVKGAVSTAAAIYLARTGHTPAQIRSEIQTRYGYDLSRSCDDIRPYYEFNESCMETVPEAITAALEAESFEDAIRLAISLGGDSDTLAAITGGIAEALFGIPTWLKLETYDNIESAFLQNDVLKFYREVVGNDQIR